MYGSEKVNETIFYETIFYEVPSDGHTFRWLLLFVLCCQIYSR